MKVFRVLVLGEHFRMEVSGDRCYMGFYWTRFIGASNLDEARAAAVAAVRADSRLRDLTTNEDDDPPLLSVDEIEEIDARDVPESEPGFILFRD